MTGRLGAIIAGGRSLRFGRDKALVEWRGRPLIAHAADLLAPWCDTIVVCGREWGGLPAIGDRPRTGLGPLGGIAAALADAEARGLDSVLTIGCDMPDVPGELLADLVRRAPAYCSDAPILGHWPASAAAPLVARLRDCQSAPDGKTPGASIRGWAAGLGALPIVSPGPLRNVNSVADLATA